MGSATRMTSGEGSAMDPTRKTATFTGVLFIIATVAAVVAAALVPVLTDTDYLTRVSSRTNQVAAAALCYLIAAFASAGIAVSLYRVLKKSNASLALGSVVFRALEAAFYMVAIVCLLSLQSLSKQFATAAATDRPSLQAIADSLVSAREHASVLAVFAFSSGAFMYYYLFYRSRLVPRWLSGWGIVSAILMATACLLALFSDNPVTGYVALFLPIAVQEMVLAVWLIVKGFDSPPLPSMTP
jgi:hypothetical protein